MADNPRIIDSHTHPFGNRNVDLSDKIHGKRETVTFRHRHPALYREFWSESQDETDALVRDMDASGIARAVIQPSVIESNDAIVAAVQRHPDRLIGLFGINDPAYLLERSDKSRVTRDGQAAFAEEVKALVDRDGLRGCGEIAGFSLHAEPGRIADDLTPLFEVLSDHRLPIQIPTAWTQFPTPFHQGVPWFVDDLAERFPEVPIIITKMGRGFLFIFEVALGIAYRHLNVYLDTVQAPADHIARAVRELGADRVLFGSDWVPTWTQGYASMGGLYANALAAVNDAELSDDEADWVLGRTCAELFGIKSEALHHAS